MPTEPSRISDSIEYYSSQSTTFETQASHDIRDGNLASSPAAFSTNLDGLDSNDRSFESRFDRTATRLEARELDFQGRKKSVNGTVLAYDEGEVKVAIESLNYEDGLSLPRRLCPARIHYGFPFSLEVRDVEGVRTPIVTRRQIQLPDASEAAEMRALLDRLPE